MNDNFQASPTPRSEAWWERELHRNEKLMDRYMKVFEDEGETAFEKYDTPDKLYNKVHYGIEPGEPLPPEALAREAGRDPDFEDWKEEALNAAAEAAEEVEDELDPGTSAAADSELTEPDEEVEEVWEEEAADPQDEQEEAAYEEIAGLARAFAVAVMRLRPQPDIEEVLILSAGKIGANLAGGHGLGYHDDTLCGNIVKCRWALADCEFCREILEQRVRRTNDPALARLVAQGKLLSAALRERIAELRSRVWW
jgi:hypothetical protein